jgi:hypothetical protein
VRTIGSFAFLAAVAFAAAAEPPAAKPHPHFNDGGTLAWYTTLTSAQAAARKGGRLIFVEYGRTA